MLKLRKDSPIYLVNARNDTGKSKISNDNCFPALGVLALGTWLRKAIPETETIVRDGGAMQQNELLSEIQKLKPGLVGVSVLAPSYLNGLELAKCAKDCGAITVFGNDHASQFSGRILRNRPYVDFVIGSEYGERSLELLLRALRSEKVAPTFDQIPDLTYRDSIGNIKGFDYDRDKAILSITNRSELYHAGSRATALDIFPILERTLYPEEHWKRYLAAYLSKFVKLHKEEITGVTTMNRARGCSRASENRKCKFCNMLLDIALSSPELFWEEVKAGHQQVNANVFYESCDSFSSFPSLISRIAATKPRDLGFDPKFFVYCQAIELVRNPGLIKQLKEIGVFRVNMGLESGSDVTLKHMKGKDDGVDTNYRALLLLKESGIHAYVSFVLGSDVETQSTLIETIGWIKRIIDEGLSHDVEVQPVFPLLQSFYGRRLIQSSLLTEEEKASDLIWSSQGIAERYINNFSRVSYSDCMKAVDELSAYAKSKGINFGSALLERD